MVSASRTLQLYVTVGHGDGGADYEARTDYPRPDIFRQGRADRRDGGRAFLWPALRARSIAAGVVPRRYARSGTEADDDVAGGRAWPGPPRYARTCRAGTGQAARWL